jgi:hypothetical protein
MLPNSCAQTSMIIDDMSSFLMFWGMPHLQCRCRAWMVILPISHPRHQHILVCSATLSCQNGSNAAHIWEIMYTSKLPPQQPIKFSTSASAEILGLLTKMHLPQLFGVWDVLRLSTTLLACSLSVAFEEVDSRFHQLST